MSGILSETRFENTRHVELWVLGIIKPVDIVCFHLTKTVMVEHTRYRNGSLLLFNGPCIQRERKALALFRLPSL